MRVLARDGQNLRFSNQRLHQAIQMLCNRQSENWHHLFERYLEAAARIVGALPMAISIDNLLHTHRADAMMVQLGKLAIATVILEKERSSCLHENERRYQGRVQLANIDTPKFASGWYLPLMRLIVTGKTLDEVENIFNNIAFIIFNYDRCLEHFLVNAVISYFNVAPELAIATVNRLTIIHPYGQVGHFDWQMNPTVKSQYGDDGGNLIEIAEQILTFTESAQEGVTGEVKQLVRGAETLVFVGFGYLPQNMQLLSVEDSEVRRTFATMYGVGDQDVSVAEAEIAEVVQKKLFRSGMLTNGPNDSDYFYSFVERGTCRELMDRHWLRLTRR
jgi:hypothetical protein